MPPTPIAVILAVVIIIGREGTGGHTSRRSDRGRASDGAGVTQADSLSELREPEHVHLAYRCAPPDAPDPRLCQL